MPKTKPPYRAESWQTKTEARLALFTDIEAWYNPRRRRSALDYLSPMNYENKRGRSRSTRGEHGLPTAGACVACATPPVDNPTHVQTKSAQALSP